MVEVSTQRVLYRFLGLVSTRFGHPLVRREEGSGLRGLVGEIPPRAGGSARVRDDAVRCECQRWRFALLFFLLVVRGFFLTSFGPCLRWSAGGVR